MKEYDKTKQIEFLEGELIKERFKSKRLEEIIQDMREQTDNRDRLILNMLNNKEI